MHHVQLEQEIAGRQAERDREEIHSSRTTYSIFQEITGFLVGLVNFYLVADEQFISKTLKQSFLNISDQAIVTTGVVCTFALEKLATL